MRKLITCALSGLLYLTSTVSYAQTGAPIRVFANTNYASDSLGWYTFDSTYYVYSGDRGGFPIISDDSWTYWGKYDTACYLAKGARNKNYYLSQRNIETFDSHNNVMTTMSQVYDTSARNWNNAHHNIYTYDANNNMLTHLIQSWDNTSSSWKNQTRYGITYDANNSMVTDTVVSWVSGMWQYSTLFLYAYNIHNDLIDVVELSYSTGSWHSAGNAFYFPNAGHKPDSIVSPPLKHVYTYDSNYDELTDTSYHEYSTGWQIDNCLINAYDAHHNQTSQTTLLWLGTGYAKSTISYNSFNADNMLDTATLAAWVPAGWKPFYHSVYYYRSPTKVNNINHVAGDMRLYPSPANSYMNIAISNTDNKPLTLAIYGMDGSLYKQWQATAGNSYNASVPLSDLPAGNYIMHVTNGAAQIMKQFTVVH